MTPKRAFWEAFATVCLPSLAFWTIIAFVLKAKAHLLVSEALPIYLLMAVLPLPLIYPLYRRYLKGPQQPEVRSRGYHIAWAVSCAILSIAYIALASFSRRNGPWSQIVMALFWAFMCIDHLRRAAKTKAVRPSPPAHAS